MTTYAYANRGAALPFTGGEGITVLKRNIDLATLVSTDYYKLALAASPTVPLTSFTGFVQNDILELWEVPAGTLIFDAGVRVTTTEGATAAATMGFNDATQTDIGVSGSATDPNAYGTYDLNSATVQGANTIAIDGTDVGFTDVFVTAGSIDMKFTTNDTYAVAVFDVWALVAKVF